MLHLHDLSQPEIRLVHLVAAGANDRELAVALNLNQREAETKVAEVLAKMDLTDRVELTLLAYSQPS